MRTISRRCRLQLFALASVLGLLLPALSMAEMAPAFVLSDADDKMVSLSDYRGKPLVLHFWATWCPYCKKLQPGLERLSQDYSAQGLVILGISFREDEGADPSGVLEARGHSFKTLIDGDEVASLYGVKGTPTTFFIDRKGELVGMTNTSDPGDPVLEKGVNAIIE